MNNKTFFVVLGVLIVVAGLALMAYLPTRTDIALSTKVSDFPKEIGEWKGTDLPIEENVYEILETRNLFIRDYKNAKGESVYLYIVYSEDNRKVSHPPEVCFLGSGATVVDKSSLELTPTITASKLLIEDAKTRSIVAYWFKAGNLNTNQYIKQQLKTVFDRIAGKRTSSALIRLSTDIKNDLHNDAISLLKSFASQIEPLITNYVP